MEVETPVMVLLPTNLHMREPMIINSIFVVMFEHSGGSEDKQDVCVLIKH